MNACGYHIVGPVLARFKGLPMKLSELTTKAHQWWSSHGLESRTQNPLSSGNKSAVDHYLRFARLYEAGAKGAGMMLNRRVFEALEAEFTERQLDIVDQQDIEVGVVDETSDIQKWLIRYDIDKAEPRNLVTFIDECKEAVDAIQTAQATATARLKYARRDKTSSLSPRAEQVTAKNGNGRTV